MTDQPQEEDALLDRLRLHLSRWADANRIKTKKRIATDNWVAKIRKQAEERQAPLQAVMADETATLISLVGQRWREIFIGDKKSREFADTSIKSVISTKLVVHDAAELVKLLTVLGKDDMLVTSVSPNVNAVKADEDLLKLIPASVAELQVVRNFTIEAKPATRKDEDQAKSYEKITFSVDSTRED